MMEYSNYPAPSIEDCKKQIHNIIYKEGNITINKNTIGIKEDILEALITTPVLIYKVYNPKDIENIISKAFEKSKVINETGENIKYSLSGWSAFGIADVLQSVAEIIHEKNQRRIQMRRQLRGILRITYLFKKWNTQVIEKMLHPDSIYVTEILKNDFMEKSMVSPATEILVPRA